MDSLAAARQTFKRELLKFLEMVKNHRQHSQANLQAQASLLDSKLNLIIDLVQTDKQLDYLFEEKDSCNLMEVEDEDSCSSVYYLEQSIKEIEELLSNK